MAEKDAEIAFSPGFRWGTSLLPGQAITMEHLMDQTAITYPYVTVNELTGETIKTILEDVADNLFNPDPYYQQGGDMVRVGGLRVRAAIRDAKMGKRITCDDARGKPLDAAKTYKVAGWAPVSEEAKRAGGEPVWDVMARYLRAQKTIAPRGPTSRGRGVAGNPGLDHGTGVAHSRSPSASGQHDAHRPMMSSGSKQPGCARPGRIRDLAHPAGYQSTATRANLRLPACTTTVLPAAIDERLVGDDFAVDLEPALRDQPQRLRRRVDDARLLRELRDRQPGAVGRAA